MSVCYAIVQEEGFLVRPKKNPTKQISSQTKNARFESSPKNRFIKIQDLNCSKKQADALSSNPWGELLDAHRNIKNFKVPILASLAIPISEENIFGLSNSSSDTHFLSTSLANMLRNGIIERSKSYGFFSNNSVISESDLKASDLKAIMESAIEQTISTLASIAGQQGKNKIEISDNNSFSEIFEDLLKQYLPSVSSEVFCAIALLLITELKKEAKSREFRVDSGKLVCENQKLIIEINRNYTLPGLLENDSSDFTLALDL